MVAKALYKSILKGSMELYKDTKLPIIPIIIIDCIKA